MLVMILRRYLVGGRTWYPQSIQKSTREYSSGIVWRNLLRGLAVGLNLSLLDCNKLMTTTLTITLAAEM